MIYPPIPINLDPLLDRIEAQESIALDGEQSGTPREHWAECLLSLEPAEVLIVEAMEPLDLGVFLFEDYEELPNHPHTGILAKIDQVLINIEARIMRNSDFANRLHMMEAKALGPAVGPSDVVCWTQFLCALSPEDQLVLASFSDDILENMLLAPENEYRGQADEFYARIRAAMESVEGWG
jgi:hypothetical protein